VVGSSKETSRVEKLSLRGKFGTMDLRCGLAFRYNGTHYHCQSYKHGTAVCLEVDEHVPGMPAGQAAYGKEVSLDADKEDFVKKLERGKPLVFDPNHARAWNHDMKDVIIVCWGYRNGKLHRLQFTNEDGNHVLAMDLHPLCLFPTESAHMLQLTQKLVKRACDKPSQTDGSQKRDISASGTAGVLELAQVLGVGKVKAGPPSKTSPHIYIEMVPAHVPYGVTECMKSRTTKVSMLNDQPVTFKYFTKTGVLKLSASFDHGKTVAGGENVGSGPAASGRLSTQYAKKLSKKPERVLGKRGRGI